MNKDIKLVNYKRGYKEAFDCVIHGTIYMTYFEWDKAYKYLKMAIKNKKISNYGFEADCKRRIETKSGFIVNIRVTATAYLAKHLKLTNYKPGNYQIVVGNDF